MASRKPVDVEGAQAPWQDRPEKQKYLPITSAEEGELLSSYFEQLKKFPPLTAAQSHQLALKVQQGDESARARLIEHHLRLVVKIAKEFRYRGVSMSDLIEEGNLGLIHAVAKFDPHKGFRFTTYAVWWIRQFIAKAVMDQSRTIRLPVHVLKTINQLLRKNVELTQVFQGPPPAKALAQGMAFDEKDLHKLQQIIQSTQMDPLSGDEEISAASWTAASSVPDCFDLVANDDLRQFILLFLKELRPQEKEVIVRRFGLLNFDVQTFEVVGQELGITKERVRQIQLSALNRLRTILTDSGLYLGSFELH